MIDQGVKGDWKRTKSWGSAEPATDCCVVTKPGNKVNANAMMKCMTNSIERFLGYVAVGASISRRPAQQQLGAFYMPQQLPLMRIILYYDFKRKYLVLVKKNYPHNSISNISIFAKFNAVLTPGEIQRPRLWYSDAHVGFWIE